MNAPFIHPHRIAHTTRDYGAVNWAKPEAYRVNLYASLEEHVAREDRMAIEFVCAVIGSAVFLIGAVMVLAF